VLNLTRKQKGEIVENEQYVCTVCGFNMVGYHPDFCPFCDAPKEKFITSEECSARFIVNPTFAIRGVYKPLSQ